MNYLEAEEIIALLDECNALSASLKAIDLFRLRNELVQLIDSQEDRKRGKQIPAIESKVEVHYDEDPRSEDRHDADAPVVSVFHEPDNLFERSDVRDEVRVDPGPVERPVDAAGPVEREPEVVAVAPRRDRGREPASWGSCKSCGYKIRKDNTTGFCRACAKKQKAWPSLKERAAKLKRNQKNASGSSSVAEREPSKLGVAGSTPACRSNDHAEVAQMLGGSGRPGRSEALPLKATSTGVVSPEDAGESPALGTKRNPYDDPTYKPNMGKFARQRARDRLQQIIEARDNKRGREEEEE